VVVWSQGRSRVQPDKWARTDLQSASARARRAQVHVFSGKQGFAETCICVVSPARTIILCEMHATNLHHIAALFVACASREVHSVTQTCSPL